MTSEMTCDECRVRAVDPGCPHGNLCVKCGYWAGQDKLRAADERFILILSIAIAGPHFVAAMVIFTMIVAVLYGW